MVFIFDIIRGSNPYVGTLLERKSLMFNLNLGLLQYLTDNILKESWQYYALYITFVVAGIAIAYLLGSVNTAIVISKMFYHDDIRNYGSGNAGLTNMLRTYGKGAAVMTLLGDMLKTALAIFITGLLLGFHYTGGISLNDGYCYVAGLFAVVGHVFPVYYGFKGGKGVLVTATMALILTPIPFLFLLAIFIAVVAVSKYVSLGSVIAAVLYPVIVNGYIKIAFSAQSPAILALCTILLAIFIVWCHRGNLQRISDRTERKISFKKKEKEPLAEEKSETDGKDEE